MRARRLQLLTRRRLRGDLTRVLCWPRECSDPPRRLLFRDSRPRGVALPNVARCAPECVELYKQLAFDNGISPAALAIAFCASRPFVTSTIVGATSLEQLDVNLQGFGVEWGADLEAEIARIHAYFPDPWRMIVRGGG